jgi:hypothetical protein
MGKRVLFASLIFLSLPYLSLAEISGEIKSSSTYYNVGGNTENSFYEAESLEYFSDLSLNLDEKFLGDWGFKGNLSLKVTDDRLVDPQDFSLENFFIEVFGKGSSFALGDFSANLSSFTVNNSLKGVRLSQDLGENLKFIALAGANFSRWEDIWEERTDDTPSRQYIGGLRLEKTIGGMGNLGLNFGASKEDDSYVSASSDPQATGVVSIDTRLTLINNLNIEAEYATSRWDKNDDAGDIPEKTDHALHLASDYRIGRFYLRGGFDRYGSNFSSLGGYTTQDFQEYFQETEIDLIKDTRLRLSYRANRDNLDKHKSTTTFQKSPTANLTFSLFRNTRIELGSDLTRRDSTDNTVEETTRRLFGRINQVIGRQNISLEYQNTRIDDNIDDTRERLNDSINLRWDTSFSLKNINFNPSLEYGVTHDEYRHILESDLTQTYGVGLGLTFPKDWEINSRINFSDFDSYQADSDQLRTRYEFSLLKRFWQDYEFSLSYEHSGYGYETSEENYNETLVSAKMNFRF